MDVNDMPAKGQKITVIWSEHKHLIGRTGVVTSVIPAGLKRKQIACHVRDGQDVFLITSDDDVDVIA